ncbi:zinc finger protein 79-like isoform X9 [Galleria mellonella]|uniref:Zinc finger protein 79-like isoform X9 n=1 Tax=Galleria mellonella TaxID=7137 RepID=A0ABM3N0S3_GALME|nr:zinc finger protein 79-like isoform X9 [Galleria mellonella]
MATKTMEWRPGPTVCRCCLAEGCYKDISTEYFWMGKREVYAEMLSETFSVSIAYSTAGGPNSNSRLICEPCISRLRDASEFKRQVQECEKTFMQHLDPGSSSALGCDGNMVNIEPEDVKVEAVKVESRLSDDEFDDRVDFGDDDDDDLDDEPLTKFATKVPKKESVDILDLLDNSKAAEKRKSSTKIKATPAKKTKKEAPKPTSSKPKPEKKKKGAQPTTMPRHSSALTVPVKIRPAEVDTDGVITPDFSKEISRNSAINILLYSTLCPFRYYRIYMCLYCSQSFLYIYQLAQHNTLEHNAMSKKDIRKSLSRIAKSQPIKVNLMNIGCKLCAEYLKSFEDLKNHLVETHKKDIDVKNDGLMPFKISDDEFRCGLCDVQCVGYRDLIKHSKGHYRNFFCEQCGAEFVTSSGLTGHLKGHIAGPFPCSDCNKVFNTYTARLEHCKRIHTKTKTNLCKYCQARFIDYYQKRKHIKEVHGIDSNEYKCSFCSKVFLVNSTLRAHERQVHLKNQNFTCDICGYQSHYKESIKRHMVCHSNEKNFKCEVCKKSYARKKTLKEHMRIHNNDRRFSCNYCGQAFIQKCSLKGHMRTHHKSKDII